MYVTCLCIIFLIKLRWPPAKSVYNVIYERYGGDTLKCVRIYEKDVNRFNKCGLDINFLEKCRLYNIAPKFSRFRLHNEKHRTTVECKRFQRELIDLEIKEHAANRKLFQQSYIKASEILRDVLSPIDFNHVMGFLDLRTKKHLETVRRRHEKKFKNLKQKLGIPDISNATSLNVVFNYSSRVLTTHEQSVLSRGLRFCLPPKTLDKNEITCSFELLYRDFWQ